MHFATTITFRAGLFKTLLTHVGLQACQLFGDGFDSLSEGEIIPFSGVSKSGAGAIIHAGGGGRSVRGTCSVELQPLTASSHVALRALHILNVIFSQF